MKTLLETADVARRRGVGSISILWDVRVGRLKVAAMTPRGTRLFAPRDVDEYLARFPPRKRTPAEVPAANIEE
jgi:hypothetical protein